MLKKIIICVLLFSFLNLFLTSNELVNKQNVQPKSFNIAGNGIKFLGSESGESTKLTKYKRIRNAGIGLTVSGLVLEGGGIGMTAAALFLILRIGLTFDITVIMSAGLTGIILFLGGLTLISIGSILFLIGLPCWIAGGALYAYNKKKMSMLNNYDYSTNSFNIGYRILLGS
jgi:hypothetical protein